MNRSRQLKPSIILTCAVLLSAPTLATVSTITCADVFSPATRSEQLSWLEKYTPERLLWIRNQNGRTNQSLRNSPNKKTVEKMVWSDYDKRQVNKTEKIDSESALNMVDQGLAKPTEIILSRKNSKPKVLLSNTDIKANQSVAMLDFTLSPDKNWLTVVYEKKGSTDNYWIQVYDLKLQQIVVDKIAASAQTIFWTSENEFIFDSRSEGLKKYNVQTGEKSKLGGGLIYDVKQNYAITKQSGKWFLLNSAGSKLPFDLVNSLSGIIGIQADWMFIQTFNKKGFLLVEKINLKSGAIETVIPNLKEVGRSVSLIGSRLVMETSLGANRRFSVFDLDGKKMFSTQLPPGLIVSPVKWATEDKKLVVMLSSPVKKAKQYTWDLESPLDLEKVTAALHRDGGQTYVTRIEQVASADGTLIPVRLTHKKDLPLDGTSGAYIHFYGGFDTSPYFEARYNPMEKILLENGGVLVAPELRGGNEFGEAWHKAAQGADKKINTVDDLIAVAEWLAREKISSPSRVIIHGTSNGGFVAALAGLKKPTAFGLVIPVAGVQDMVGKDRLDARYDGWRRDYGLTSNPKDYPFIEALSPVEYEINDQRIRFFIINGQNDTRVNPAHSYKLTQSLLDQNVNVNLSSINNSGHWNESIPYQDIIGWRVQVLIWTEIFDFLNIRLPAVE